jgi:hypothetical protein
MQIKENERMNQYKLTMRIGELGFSQKKLRPTGKKASNYWVGLKVKRTAVQGIMAGITVQTVEQTDT